MGLLLIIGVPLLFVAVTTVLLVRLALWTLGLLAVLVPAVALILAANLPRRSLA